MTRLLALFTLSLGLYAQASATGPVYTLDSQGTVANELSAYYAPPAIPAAVPATGLTMSAIEIQMLNFAWDQQVRVPNTAAYTAYNDALNSWKGAIGTIPQTAPPHPPAYVWIDTNKFEAAFQAYANNVATGFNNSVFIVPYPLPPAPTITNAPPPTPPNQTTLSLVSNTYSQGIWLATPFANMLASAGAILPGQTVIPWAASATGCVEFLMSPFASVGIWYPAACPR